MFEIRGFEPVFLNQEHVVDYAKEPRVLSLYRDFRFDSNSVVERVILFSEPHRRLPRPIRRSASHFFLVKLARFHHPQRGQKGLNSGQVKKPSLGGFFPSFRTAVAV